MSLAGCALAEERHALAMAIREVCAMTDDEPDGDLAARLREHVAYLHKRADLAEQIKREAIEGREAAQIRATTAEFALHRVAGMLEAAEVLTQPTSHPTAEAVRVAMLRGVRA
jgi:hypothetical protein